jgi:hypothetical protein
MYIMNREELKKHITNFRLNLPQGVKFSVIAQSAAVLESSKDLHCEYLYVAMDRHGYNWARMTYGEIETRIEGSWIGTSWLKVYPCYDEEHLVMVDGVPCQYVGETNPFQDDPMLERPVPSIDDYMRHPSQRANVVQAMADVLKEGMTERDGLIDISPEAVQAALRVSAVDPAKPVVVLGDKPMITRRTLESAQPFVSRGIIVAPPIKGDESDAALYAKHFLGDASVLDKFIADGLESRSASKALLQNPTSLKDTPQGMSQIHRLRSQPFFASEYRGSLVRCSEDQLGLTDDKQHNLRQYNSASLRVKVAYKRRLAAWARSLAKESLTAQCTATGWLERRTPMSPEGEQVGTYGFGRNGLVRKQVYGTPIPPRELDDHSVDSIAVARMYRPGAEGTEPVHTVFLDPELPKEVNDTIEKFIGDEDKKEDKE